MNWLDHLNAELDDVEFLFPPPGGWRQPDREATDADLLKIMPWDEWRAIEQAALAAHDGHHRSAEVYRGRADYDGLWPENGRGFTRGED